MRKKWLYLAASAILMAVKCPATTAERLPALPREAAASTKDAAAASTSHSPASSTGRVTSIAPSDGMGSTSENLATSTNAAASSSPALVTATPIVKGSLNVNGTTTPKIDGLPIHPKITPALAIAGPILILTGVLYTLIGIRIKWLHIFLSTAYIFALAVAILIEFVMHTPVSNAAQGAYVVAACVTGLVAGGGSLLFGDVTQGISLCLGGFCFSMWVLILRPGGTIPNTTGKIILISCLTVGAPALYISRHTRPYSLIGTTSFAGSTATVLGIDCFSRAGLKEFWLYIWNINNEVFPLHYDGPYPITRGIQAETGAIVIICAMGVVSQMRVWKMIKQRQEQTAREQRRNDEEDNIADGEHGRRVEFAAMRERSSWEAAYSSAQGGKPRHVDSSIGTDDPSTRRGSSNVAGSPEVPDRDSEGIELQELDASPSCVKEDGRVIVHVVADDEISPTHPATGQHSKHSTRESGELSINESQTLALNPLGPETSLGNDAAVGLIDESLTLKPKIVHLPFKVPHSEYGCEDGSSSVAASAASDPTADSWSKRLSGSSIVRKLSKRSQQSYITASTSEEAFMVAGAEDDKASSVAATIDRASENDDVDEEALSVRDQRPSFEILSNQDSMQAVYPSGDLGKDVQEPPRERTNEVALDDSHAEERVEGLTDARPESIALPESDFASVTVTHPPVEEPNMASRASVAPESEVPGQHHRINDLSGNLPQGASKVVTAYRTNEWAKHLDGADMPEIDELRIGKHRALDSVQPEERAAPVDTRALQQTALNADPAPTLIIQTHNLGERPAAYFQAKNPFHRQPKTQQSRPTVHQLTRDKAMERTPSQSSLANGIERSSSQTSLSSTQSRKEQYRPPLPKFRSSQASIPSARAFRRSSSNPLLNAPLVDSPIEEDVEASFPPRLTSSSTNLLAHSDSLPRNKSSSTPLLRTSRSNAPQDQHPALRDLNDNENISLSQRKSLLQQNPHSIPQPYRSSSGATTPIYSHTGAPPTTKTTPRTRTSLPPQPHPSPSPLSTRRASLHPAFSPQSSSLLPLQSPPAPTTTTTKPPLQQVPRTSTNQLSPHRGNPTNKQENRTITQPATPKALKERDVRRRSSLWELHQQQMRKMQAVANRSLEML
ncbi:hypothetical protein BDR22DRAFT_817809 [Usnea florida]